MRKVFTIGETVLDLIFKRNKILFAKPGGAMLNSAVSLGKLSIPVSFITEVGEDNAGNYILEFLHQNDVDTSYCYRFIKGQTALALAFLDEHENADYSFYKNYPIERMKQKMPLVSSKDIVLFGSFFAITREVRIPLMNFIKQANRNNAIILYDPNFRKPHLHELPEIRDDILENISYSSIVRGSDEDFKLIFNVSGVDEAFDIIKENGCSFLIYTAGDKPVEFRSTNLSLSFPVPHTKSLSTIGAGDSFNAGIIYNLVVHGLYNNDLANVKKEVWGAIVKSAIGFGSHVCTHYDNYITHDFAKQVRN